MKDETLRPTAEAVGQDEIAQGRLGAALSRLLGEAGSRIKELKDRSGLNKYRTRFLNRNYDRMHYVNLAIEEINRDCENGMFDQTFRDSLIAEIREKADAQQRGSKFGD